MPYQILYRQKPQEQSLQKNNSQLNIKYVEENLNWVSWYKSKSVEWNFSEKDKLQFLIVFNVCIERHYSYVGNVCLEQMICARLHLIEDQIKIGDHSINQSIPFAIAWFLQNSHASPTLHVPSYSGPALPQ